MQRLFFGAISALALLISSPSAAQENALSDFYIGLYGGYTWMDADNDNGADPEPEGFDYGLFGGYRIDSMFANTNYGLTGALEAFIGGSTADDEIGGVDIEKGLEYGFSFRPGFAFLNQNAFNINPYGIIGYRNTELEASSGGLSTDENYHGFELGLGADILQLDNNIGVRAEYSYVWYMEDNDIDPSEGNLRLGLSYQF